MTGRIASSWWVLAVRGGLAVLLGLLALVHPAAALAALVTLFGAYALVDGVFALLTAARFAHRDDRWWLLILEGVVGVAVGVLTFIRPAATALALIYLVASWAILTGALEIAAAIRLRRVIQGEWLLGLVGAASVLLGVVLLAAPGAGLLAWVWMLGAYALVFGLGLLGLAFRLRRLESEHAQARSSVWPPP